MSTHAFSHLSGNQLSVDPVSILFAFSGPGESAVAGEQTDVPAAGQPERELQDHDGRLHLTRAGEFPGNPLNPLLCET